MRDGWRQTTLADVAAVNPKVIGVDESSPFITMSDVAEWGRWAKSTSSRGSRGGVRARGGDVLVARITPCLENGKIAQVPHDWPAVGGSTEFIVVRAGDEVLPDFLYLWAQMSDTHQRAVSRMIGSTGRQRVSASDFAALPIFLPSLVEQRRIVDLIAALDDTIRASHDTTVSALETLDQLRDRLPDGARTCLGDILLAIESGASTKPIAGEGKRINVLTLAAIRPGRFYPEEIKDVGPAPLPEKGRLKEGDLLITRSNTPERVGYVAIAENVLPDTFIPDLVWRLVPDENQVTKTFLAHALSSPRMRAVVTGAASGTSQSMRKINKANFSALMIALPTKADQERYVAPLNALTSVIVEQDAFTTRLRSARTEILTALLSGAHEIPASYDDLFLEGVAA